MLPPTTDSGSAETSASETLAQDLVELLKVDKRTIFGESTLGSTAETAARAAAAATAHLKSAFGKLRNKGKAMLTGENKQPLSEPEEGSDRGPGGPAVTDDEIYTEGCQNEMGEEEARVAFCTFYLSVMGDMRWYLTTVPGQTPTLDHDRFLQQKRQLGCGEGSPIFPLLQNMCQSQMFLQFVNARVEEIRLQIPVSKDSPLFSVCANYHRQHQIDFSVINVRRVTRQVAQVNPSRLMSQANASARRDAMALTSNKQFEGNQGQAIAQLVEACHETSVLMDVMSVLWMRLRDCKGMNWKHGLTGLQIMRNLLYHGPIAAISEATDGIDTIRMLKAYSNQLRGPAAKEVQQAASQVYELLVDRSKLFSLRRVCANRRRELNDPQKGALQKDRNLQIFTPFRSLHPYLHPQNSRRMASAPQHQAPPMMQDNSRLVPSAPGQAVTADWLDSTQAPVQQTPPMQLHAVQDMLGVLSISSPAPHQPVSQIDPFAPMQQAHVVSPPVTSIDPFASAPVAAPRSIDPFAPVPQHGFVHHPPPFAPAQPPAHPLYAHMPPHPHNYPGGQPTHAQMSSPHFQQSQSGTHSIQQSGYPPQQPGFVVQQPSGYSPQPNQFAPVSSFPQQGPPPQQQRSANVQQFDPLRKDPFA
jgi:hypothetical protein